MMQMSDLKNIRAVIFDMDGLLLDSEPVGLSAFVESCRECGYEPDTRVYYKCIGTNYAGTKEVLTREYGPGFPFDDIYPIWHKKYREGITSVPMPLKPGARDILNYLETEGIKKAVVTSTRQETASKMLSNTNLLDYFEFVLGGDQIEKGKPDPEIYLTGCRRLGEEPTHCLALEDSDNGVLAAYSAGVEVIQVPDLIEPSDRVKALGHRIVRSLGEVERLFRQSTDRPSN
jgi:HAD superfamily hydrolase (TIGR01509 family)